MSAPTDYVEVEIAIAADVAKVWSFVSDINVPAQFSREFQGAEWLDTPGLGGTFRGDNAVGDYKWSTTSIVTDSPKTNHLHGQLARWKSRSLCGALLSLVATAMCC